MMKVSFLSAWFKIQGLPRRAFMTAFMAFVVAAPFETAPARAADDPVPVRVSLFSWPGYGFWFIAKEKNLVPEIDLQISIIEDPYQSFAMLAADQLDVASSTAEYGPLAASEGNAVRLVTYTNPSYGTDKIIVRPGIDAASQLAGERVAVMEGGLTQIFMGVWLEENDVSIEDVEFVNLIMDDATAAMISGDVAAGEFWEPFGQAVLDNLPGSKVVATSDTPFWAETALLGDAMYMREDFIDDPSGAAALAMKAYFAAVKYWRENTAEANQIIADGLNFPVSDVEGVIGSDGSFHQGGIAVYGFENAARFMGLKPGNPPLGQKNDQIEKHYQMVSDWWVKFGLIPDVPPFDKGVSLEPMKTLVDEGYVAD